MKTKKVITVLLLMVLLTSGVLNTVGSAETVEDSEKKDENVSNEKVMNISMKKL